LSAEGTTHAARYPRAVRRAFLLVIAVAFLAACGSSGGSKGPAKHAVGIPVTFGIKGGNVAPLTIAISGTGRIKKLVGGYSMTKTHVSTSLSNAVKADLAGVSSRRCKGTLPDVGSRYITAAGKTVTVHGTCEPAFEKVWRKLTAAVGFD
jgi:hypothetical protein